MSVETTTRDESTSLAELDPDQLTDSDELYHMAQAMRDDEYFEVPIVNWEKQNDAVLVTIITPNGETAQVHETWPEKPTTENNFIRACMCALDVDNAKDAALMADDLQDVSHADFTVPADKSGHRGWELKPEVDMPTSLRGSMSIADDEADSLSTKWKLVAILCGPLALLVSIADTHGNVDFDDDTLAQDAYWNFQSYIYATIGTALWVIVLLLA